MSASVAPVKGLEGVVAAHTRLSDVRGESGQLIYCGYDRKELADYKAALAEFRELPEGVVDIIREFPKDAPPMHAIRTGISALGCFDTTCDDDSQHAQRRKALRLIAQIPVVTAYFHRHRMGKGLVHPDPSLGEAGNFLYMINGEKPSREAETTLDLCYVLHADHGMNASTFSARVTI